MTVSLFAFIAWMTIIIFSVIRKGLNIFENFILFFLITIVVINNFTIISLNLKLIENTFRPDMFISLVINRNIIIPLCILTFLNLLSLFKEKLKKILVVIITLLILVLDELLVIWTGLIVYRGWNIYLSIINLLVILTISTLLVKELKKLS